MVASDLWFRRMGFEVWQVPGVSRAWRKDAADGSYVLVTDVGGYDLPEPEDPCVGMALSRRNESLDFAPLLADTQSLYRWLRHVDRLAEYLQRKASSETAESHDS